MYINLFVYCLTKVYNKLSLIPHLRWHSYTNTRNDKNVPTFRAPKLFISNRQMEKKKKKEQGWGIHKSSQQLSRWIYTEIHMQGISLAQYTTCKEIAWVYVMYVHISSYIQFEKTSLDSIFIGDLAQCKVVPLSYFPALAELILPDARR